MIAKIIIPFERVNIVVDVKKTICKYLKNIISETQFIILFLSLHTYLIV